MAENKEKPELEKVRRELKRRSLDQLKVYNPLTTPFQTIYDGFTYVCNPQKEATFLRYIAEKWMKEFVDYMINTEEQEAVDLENDKRKKKGWEVMSPQERDQFAIRGHYLTNDPNKRLQYMKMVYKGVSQEHGLDIPEPVAVKRDRRPQDEKLLEQLDREMGLLSMIPDVAADDIEDVEDKKEELLEAIK